MSPPSTGVATLLVCAVLSTSSHAFVPLAPLPTPCSASCGAAAVRGRSAPALPLASSLAAGPVSVTATGRRGAVLFAAEGGVEVVEPIVSPVPMVETEVTDCKDLPFTIENVDKVLDEVRPYLISDGGNCRVVGADPDTRIVSLVLEGACGSCPSSTVTMKMGIERVLKENFKDLGGVEQVEDPVQSDVTLDIVEQLLEPIRPAVKAMKGEVSVKSAFQGEVVVVFSGPKSIAKGIKGALLDSPMIQVVSVIGKDGVEIVV